MVDSFTSRPLTVFSSSTGTGIFTTGIVGFAFAKLGEITPRANEIFQAAEHKMMKNGNSYPPGLLEQYKISLERLKDGVGCEFISFPGMCSQPSTFNSVDVVRHG